MPAIAEKKKGYRMLRHMPGKLVLLPGVWRSGSMNGSQHPPKCAGCGMAHRPNWLPASSKEQSTEIRIEK